MKLVRIIAGTRYPVIVPIIGLALAAGTFFVFGGFGLIKFLVEAIMEIVLGTGQKRTQTISPSRSRSSSTCICS